MITTTDFSLIDNRFGICPSCPLASRIADIGFVPGEEVGLGPYKVLFCAESPGFGELRNDPRRPLIGQSGTLLRELLDTILSSYVLFNAVLCHPTSGSIRTPQEDERNYCRQHVQKLIEQYNFDLIVCLGDSAGKALIPDIPRKATVGSMIRNSPYTIDDRLYICEWHPAYLGRQGGKSSTDYSRWRNRLSRYLHKFSDDTIRLGQKTEIASSHNIKWSVHQPDELPSILKTLDSVGNRFGLDYETRGLNTWNEDNIPVGFALSFVTSLSTGRSFYVDLSQRGLSEEERDEFISFLNRHEIVAYNKKFEQGVTWKNYGSRVHFDDAYDYCKLDNHKGSLKENARFYFSDDFAWEDRVHTIWEAYKKLFKLMDIWGRIYPKQIQILRNGNLVEWNKLLITDKKFEKKVNVLCRAYDVVLSLVSEEDLQFGLSKYPYYTAAVNPLILGEYCSYDSYFGLQLFNLIEPKYKEQYDIFNKQTELAALLEFYGQCWDEDKAKELEQQYVEEMVICLRNLIQYIDIPDEEKLKAAGLDTENKEKTLMRLKEFFNPNSNDKDTQAIFWNVYRNEATERYVALMYLETEINQSDSLEEDKLIPLFDTSSIENTVKSLFGHEKDNPKGLRALQNIIQGTTYGKNALLPLTDAVDSLFQGFDQDTLLLHFQAFENYGSVDIEDKTTWSKDFTMLYLLKRFRKIVKSVGTYINGEVGRRIISIVPISDFKFPSVRIAAYEARKKTNNEIYVNNPSFRNGLAATFRWTSPLHVLAKSELKSLYKARFDDRMLVHADFSQQELRCMAYITQDEEMLKALESGADLHALTASQCFGVPLDKVSPEQRQYGKVANFGVQYRQGIANWARANMKGNISMAEEFFKAYYEAHPNIKAYMDKNDAFVLQKGYVESWFGEHLHIEESHNKEAKKRDATNYPIQNMGSHLAALAIYHLYEEVESRKLDAFPIEFTHDSSQWDTKVDIIPEFLPLMRHAMVDWVRETYGVPVEIEYDIGNDMYDQMKLFSVEENTYKFFCKSSTFPAIIERLQRFLSIEYTIKKEETKKDLLRNIFNTKGGFSSSFGTDYVMYSGELNFK